MDVLTIEAPLPMTRKSASEVRDESWPEVVPLFASAAPEPYPLAALPAGIHEAVTEAHEYVQCPVALVATSALTALSLVGQGLAQVYRDERLGAPCSLYFLMLGESGERKSAADLLFTAPIRAWERSEAERLDADVKVRTADIRAWEKERDGFEAKLKVLAKREEDTGGIKAKLREHEMLKPSPLKVPHVLFSNVTIERIETSLAERWPSAGLLTSEGGTVFGGHSFRGDALLQTLAILNERWDGAPLRRERHMAASARCEVPRLTVGIAIQPGAFATFNTAGKGLARGSGFWARFLMSFPESTQGTRTYREPAVMPMMAAFHRQITAMLERTKLDDKDELSLSMLEFSDAGKTAWQQFYAGVESELSKFGEFSDVRDFASKAADNAARLAALFTLYRTAGSPQLIDDDATNRAAAIVAWHLGEARRIVGGAQADPATVAASQVESWLVTYAQGIGSASVSTRDVLRNVVPARFRKAAELDAALIVLSEHGRARLREDGKRRFIDLHPDVYKGAL